jgi:hypothetical protein
LEAIFGFSAAAQIIFILSLQAVKVTRPPAPAREGAWTATGPAATIHVSDAPPPKSTPTRNRYLTLLPEV